MRFGKRSSRTSHRRHERRRFSRIGRFETLEQRRLLAVIPTDSLFASQWALNNTGQTGGTVDADVDAVEAWDIGTGTGATVVAIIDSGLEFTHPDFNGRLYTNPVDPTVNGVDDDGNGKVDDVHGMTAEVLNGFPAPVQGSTHSFFIGGPVYHGTGVASVVGASANGVGVVGVDWNATLMSIDCMASGFTGSNPSTSYVAQGIEYAVAKKLQDNVNVRVINLSLGVPYGPDLAAAMQDAAAAGILVVVAAGNEGLDIESSMTPFLAELYPYTSNVISVAATDQYDHLADFSNFSATYIALAAPGDSIQAATGNGGYALQSGTSLATPMVSGTAALLFDTFPTATLQQVRDAILGGVDHLASLVGKTATGGRLNINNAMTQMGQIAPQAIDDFKLTNGTAPVVVDVLANDSQLGNASLLNPASVQVNQPLYGSVAVNPLTGAATYTPGPNFPGYDRFTYTVANHWGTRSAAAEVTIGPRHLPTMGPLPTLAASEGHQVTFTATATSGTTELNLSYSLGPDAPAGAVINSTTGVFTWTPPDNAPTPYRFRVIVTDNGTPQLSDFGYAQISVANVAPIATISGASLLARGASTTFTLGTIDVAADQSANNIYDFDWDNDGTYEEQKVGPSGTQITHTFPQTTLFKVRVTDKDGGTSAPVGFSVGVGFTLEPSQTDPGLIDLVYRGTDLSDELALRAQLTGSAYHLFAHVTRDNGVATNADFALPDNFTGQIVMYGNGGDDYLSTQVTDTFFLTRSNGMSPTGPYSTLFGGTGNDQLIASSYAIVYGDSLTPPDQYRAGDDIIQVGPGSTAYGDYGGDGGEGGNDQITAAYGDCTIYGDSGGNGAQGGDDVITTNGGHNVIYGDFGGSAALGIFGRTGSDIIRCNSYGGVGDQVWTDYPGATNGAEGNNIVMGGNGNDVIHGGQGHDVLVGGGGIDQIYGAGGDDVLVAMGLAAADGNDAHTLALLQNILSAIESTATYQSRMANIWTILNGQMTPIRDHGPFDSPHDYNSMTGGDGNDVFVCYYGYMAEYGTYPQSGVYVFGTNLIFRENILDYQTGEAVTGVDIGQV